MRQKLIKFMVLLLIAVAVILMAADSRKSKTKKPPLHNAAVSCVGNQGKSRCISNPMLDECYRLSTEKAPYTEQTIDTDDPNVKYQLEQPCHFMIYVDYRMGLAGYSHRNIDTACLYDGEGQPDLHKEWIAYLADTVLDRYICEYGGKDALYTVDWAHGGLPDDCDELRIIDVSGENVRLKILFSYKTSVVSVTIENTDGAETRADECIRYANDSSFLLENGLRYNFDEKVYWMIINPEHADKAHRFRNVAVNDDSGIDARGYYIADQVIDRYIRDFAGIDDIYQVRLAERKFTISHGNTYKIQAESGNALLLIEYSDDSWIVSVEAQDEELDIGVAEQEDIDKAGNQKILKKLHLALRDSLDIEPISGLTNLEILDVTVGTDKSIDLSPIGRMTWLKELRLYETERQTHEVSYFLENLKELEELSVAFFRVDNLKFLMGMTKLKTLAVLFVEDSDLAYLKNNRMVEYLNVKGYNIRNTEPLAGMDNLRHVILWEMERDPEKRGKINMEAFSNKQSLESLTIVRLGVEDLSPISDLQNLEEIVLVDTGIEDIRCLASLPNLDKLEIYGEGAQQLKEQAEKYLAGVRAVTINEEVTEQRFYYCN